MEKTLHGALSYSLSSADVSLSVTRDGGMLAPVEFKLGDRIVSPYSLSPWLPEDLDPSLPVLLKNLRGDFFCFPFGPQADGQPHGDTANATWNLVAITNGSLTMDINPTDVGGKVTKQISLREGHKSIYVEHKLEGVEGEWSYGTHPILDLSAMPEASCRLSVSPFRWAAVYPEIFSSPADGAKQLLKAGGVFSDLAEVPLEDGETTDLTYYPVRAGSDDLVMMINEDATEAQPFAWSACVMDGFLWFALKNPADFPATLFWLSNGGRTAQPWCSNHIGRIGIEEVCSHFCDSVDVSRKDRLRNLSVPTVRAFRKDQVTSLRFIQGVAAVPQGFGKVLAIVPNGDGKVTIRSKEGINVNVDVDWRFL